MRRNLTTALALCAFISASLNATQTRILVRALQRVMTIDAPQLEPDLAQYVNPFVGTDNDGNTFPGATVPFGMVQWSPDTTANGFYHYRDSKIRGFSLTHLSGA